MLGGQGGNMGPCGFNDLSFWMETRRNQEKKSIKLGCGSSTYTRAELLALWASLYIAKDIGLPYLHIFGNSSVIINWAKGESTLDMVNLEAWCLNTGKLMSSFTLVDFNHVYREHNKRAVSLSNEGMRMASGHLLLT